MNKGIIIGIVVLLAIVVLGYWLMQSPASPEPVAPIATEIASPNPSDDAESINKDLESVDIGNIESDFMDVEKDTQSL